MPTQNTEKTDPKDAKETGKKDVKEKEKLA